MRGETKKSGGGKYNWGHNDTNEEGAEGEQRSREGRPPRRSRRENENAEEKPADEKAAEVILDRSSLRECTYGKSLPCSHV